MSTEAEILKQVLLTKKPNSPIPTKNFLSSGSTLLNLACSGKLSGAFPKGSYIFFVGDSMSGKSFFMCTILAEASINTRFDDYNLFYDDIEGGILMDFERFFGERMAERIKPPIGTWEDPTFSTTTDEFYANVNNCLKDGPCIYILDSMDALLDEEDLIEKKKKTKEGKEKGSYGTQKAKANSRKLRLLLKKLKDTGSLLFIISQTRDNFGFSAMLVPKTRSGGHALTFYATVEIWTSVGMPIKKTIKGKLRKIGVTSKIKIKKNRICGQNHTVEVPIYYSHGIDDIGSCVNYLIEEGHWKKPSKKKKTDDDDDDDDDDDEPEDKEKKGSGSIFAPEFDFTGPPEKLIRYLQSDEEKELELKRLVYTTWNEIVEAGVVQRKSKYH